MALATLNVANWQSAASLALVLAGCSSGNSDGISGSSAYKKALHCWGASVLVGGMREAMSNVAASEVDTAKVERLWSDRAFTAGGQDGKSDDQVETDMQAVLKRASDEMSNGLDAKRAITKTLEEHIECTKDA